MDSLLDILSISQSLDLSVIINLNYGEGQALQLKSISATLLETLSLPARQQQILT